MSTDRTVGDRLARARRQRFVGRHVELARFRSFVVGGADGPPAAVLFVHGVGGVGKTALLGRFVELAQEAGVPTVQLDARTVDPSPPAFLAGLAAALGLPEGADPLEVLRTGGRRVFLLDTYEVAAPLDDWLRDRLLPQLPSDVLVVIAGRNPPGPEWIADPGWQEAVEVLPLRNLGAEDARAYLSDRGVADARQERVIELTHGHPLALALMTDVLAQKASDDVDLELVDTPDVVRTLLERFVQGVPSGGYRDALEVCAHARFTTEELLQRTVGGAAADLFAWLRTLSFVEEGRLGVFPHDLARAVLDADLRWRDPARYRELHGRIRAEIVRRAREGHGLEQQRACTDILFLHRTNPRIRPYLDWTALGGAYADELRPGDRDPILAMAARHEGEASAALVAHWLDRQPEAFSVFRESGDEPIGFTARLALHTARDDDFTVDPGARAMWAYAVRRDPPQPGQEVLTFRFFMDRVAYQGRSASFNLWSALGIQHIVTASRVAWSLVAFADADAIGALFADIDYHRAEEADFEVGGRRYAVFAHDFRRVPPAMWLELTAQREISEDSRLRADLAARPTAMSEQEFADAVRHALRDLHQPDRLANNALLQTRIVREAVDGGTPPEQALVTLVRDAASALRAHPRDEKFYRALDRTYLRPAETQERAAEVLQLPFSTYRRHLTHGIERVATRLWQEEQRP